MREDLIQLRPEGLYCPAGDFHIDPWLPVARAVLTHAHGDHARPGMGHYLAATESLPLLQARLGDAVAIQTQAYGVPLRIGEATVSLHPAGHVLGSAQVRVEVGGRVWVATGDYKREADPTCAPFEPQRCETLISEATFALPIYRWDPVASVIAEMLAWWDQCAARGTAAVLLCYALGKAQRILAELARHTDRPVYVHGAMLELVAAYRSAGVAMLPTLAVADTQKGKDFAGQLVLAPPSAAASPWMRRFRNAETGFASGWMRIRGNRRRAGHERGFVLSDHADWPALLATVRDSGAERVIAQHGHGEALARHLREQGLAAEAWRDDARGAA